MIQSQPCHWRNLKGVSKREAPSEDHKTNTTLSDNISLFQALRVLQDDDGVDEDDSRTSIGELYSCFLLKR